MTEAPVHEDPCPSKIAMEAAVDLEVSAALGVVQTQTIGKVIQRAIDRAVSGSLSNEAVHIMRKAAMDGLGFQCTFVDDNMRVLVGLAQRAVLAGLDTDADADMQHRFRAAAEQHRAAHEQSLGHPIERR